MPNTNDLLRTSGATGPKPTTGALPMNSAQLAAIDPSLIPLGKEDCVFSGLASPRSANKGSLLFIKDERFLRKLEARPEAKGVHLIAPQELHRAAGDRVEAFDGAVFLSPNIHVSLSRVSKAFHDRLFGDVSPHADGRTMGTARIHPSTTLSPETFVGEGASIGRDCVIHPRAVIMARAAIGDGSEIFPNVTVYPYAKIGRNTRIHAGAVIGADGFGYNMAEGVHHKVWHIGSVMIGDNAEVGAGSCVDGGTIDPTTLGDGAKIDNQVQVGHNAQIGRGVILCGQAGVSGSVTIGDFCFIGGKVGIADGVTIGRRCKVAGGSMVSSDLPDDSVVAGYPARPAMEWARTLVRVKSLDKKEGKA